MRLETKNPLFPVFFKLKNLKVLIVGGGKIGHEKIHFLFKSSPDAKVTLIAPTIRQEIKDIIASNQYNINWIPRVFKNDDISDFDLIVAATNYRDVNHQVQQSAKKLRRLVNVADTPELCDFYMGSIVTRGSLKVAISTNGQSPTFAKRFRQYLEKILPESTDALIDNLHAVRNNMKNDFNYKVTELNNITQSLVKDIQS